MAANEWSATRIYDAENRLTQVGGFAGDCSTATACYLYNASGERVAKQTGSSLTYYVYGSDGQVVSERDTNNNWSQSYLHFGGQYVALYRGTATGFVHQDHLGSVRLITLMDKSVYDTMDYLPFGEQIAAGGHLTSHEFTGKERDSESGLDHALYRQYAFSSGRWTTSDPADLAAACSKDPQTQNRYAYVTNNPVNKVDRLGLWGEDGGGGGCPWWDLFCGGGSPFPGGGGGSGGGPIGGPSETPKTTLQLIPLGFFDFGAKPPLANCVCSSNFLLPRAGLCRYTCDCGVGIKSLFSFTSSQRYFLDGMVPVKGCRKASKDGQECPATIHSIEINIGGDTSYGLLSCPTGLIQ
jgi:RHS repeat-associated protein